MVASIRYARAQQNEKPLCRLPEVVGPQSLMVAVCTWPRTVDPQRLGPKTDDGRGSDGNPNGVIISPRGWVGVQNATDGLHRHTPTDAEYLGQQWEIEFEQTI